MKKVICLAIILLGICRFPIFSQGPDHFWYREEAIEEWWVDNLNPAIVFLKSNTSSETASGVLLVDDSTVPVVLSVGHFLTNEKDSINIYLNTDGGKLDKFGCNILKIDRELDVMACIPYYIDKKLNVTDKFLDKDSFAGDEYLKRGRDILFMGFPLQEGITARFSLEFKKRQDGTLESIGASSIPEYKHPIARYGHIAATNSKGVFLIDAMVNHGNSGSPIFIRGGSYEVGHNYRFGGLITAFLPDTIEYTSKDGQTISIPHNSGLGVVTPITDIKKFLKNLKGLKF